MRFWRPTMMLIAICITLSLTASAADKDKKFSVATIKNIEKVPDSGPSHMGSDAPLASEVDTFRITVDLDGKDYIVEYEGFGDSERDVSGMVGKKYQAYVKGRVLYFKSSGGRLMRLPIVK